MAKGSYRVSSPARETSPEDYSGVWDIVEQYGEQKAGSWPFQEDDTSPKSLRFDGSSAYLSRTLTASSNRRTWTMSMWVFAWNFWVYRICSAQDKKRRMMANMPDFNLWRMTRSGFVSGHSRGVLMQTCKQQGLP